MQEFFEKQHFTQIAIAIFLSIVMGIAAIAPALFFAIETRSDYAGVVFAPNDAELHYLAAIERIAQNDAMFMFLGDIPLGESEVFPSPAEKGLSAVAEMFGIDTNTLFLSTKFLFTMLLALVLLCLGVVLTKSFGFGALFMMGVLLTLGSQSMPLGNLLGLLSGSSVSTELMPYARFTQPLVSGAVFWLAFLFAFLGFTKNRYFFVGYGVMLGISLYLYFFFWSFLLVFSGLFFLYLLRFKIQTALYLLLGTLLGILIGTPKLIALLKSVLFSGDTLGFEFLFTHSRDPIIGKMFVVAGAVVFCIYLTIRLLSAVRFKESLHFCFLLLVSLGICLNQQVVSGIAIEPGHYHWYITKPLLILYLLLLLSIILYTLKSRVPFLNRKFIVTIGIVAVILSGTLGQIDGSAQAYSTFLGYQQYGNATTFLSDHIPPQSILLTNYEFADVATVYSSFFSTWSTHARYYKSYPLERRSQIAALYTYLDREESDSTKPITTTDVVSLKVLPTIVCSSVGKGGEACVPEALLDRSNEILTQLVEEGGLGPLLNDLGVSYIVWDQEKNPYWKQKIESLGGERIYLAPPIAVYSLTKERYTVNSP